MLSINYDHFVFLKIGFHSDFSSVVMTKIIISKGMCTVTRLYTWKLFKQDLNWLFQICDRKKNIFITFIIFKIFQNLYKSYDLLIFINLMILIIFIIVIIFEICKNGKNNSQSNKTFQNIYDLLIFIIFIIFTTLYNLYKLYNPNFIISINFICFLLNLWNI